MALTLFNFTIQRVPNLIEETLALAGKSVEQIDYFILHQSNQFMMNHLIKKLGSTQRKSAFHHSRVRKYRRTLRSLDHHQWEFKPAV